MYKRQEPGLISLGVLIVDARHKPTADDVTMFQWFRGTGCPVVVDVYKRQVVGYPEVELASCGKDGVVFKCTVAVYPEVTLGQYKGCLLYTSRCV